MGTTTAGRLAWNGAQHKGRTPPAFLENANAQFPLALKMYPDGSLVCWFPLLEVTFMRSASTFFPVSIAIGITNGCGGATNPAATDAGGSDSSGGSGGSGSSSGRSGDGSSG